jgi:hypothetical protein
MYKHTHVQGRSTHWNRCWARKTRTEKKSPGMSPLVKNTRQKNGSGMNTECESCHLHLTPQKLKQQAVSWGGKTQA